MNNSIKNCSLLISDTELVSSNELMKLISQNFSCKLRLFKLPMLLLLIIFYFLNKKVNLIELIAHLLLMPQLQIIF